MGPGWCDWRIAAMLGAVIVSVAWLVDLCIRPDRGAEDRGVEDRRQIADAYIQSLKRPTHWLHEHQPGTPKEGL